MLIHLLVFPILLVIILDESEIQHDKHVVDLTSVIFVMIESAMIVMDTK